MVDQFCQHFTTHPFNDSFISELASVSPKEVLDVAAGQGSLSLAARGRYQGARVTTLEINSASVSFLRNVMPEGTHLRADLLRLKLPAPVLRLLKAADLVLCNPPFRAVDSTVNSMLLNQAGMPADWPVLLRQRTEVAFLAHNLRMLKQGGELGMFLPASFMTGHTFEPFRDWLLNSLTVEKVIGFPTSAFGGTEAKVFALIARKLTPAARHRTTLLELDRDGSRNGKVAVNRSDAITRLDAGFHLAQTQQATKLTLGAVGATLTRGWPVRELEATHHTFFHTTNFKDGSERRVFRGFQVSEPKAPIANTGDFLLGRVGRACHTQVLCVQSGSTLFSDCVYRLQVPREFCDSVRRSLISEAGVRWRRSRMHGAGASILSERDLLEHPIWLVGAP